MKRTLALFIVTTVIISLVGCGTDPAAEARAAFDNGDYETVINILSEVEAPDEELQNLMVIAEASLAFEAKDYEKVVELLKDKPHREEQEMFSVSLIELIEAAFKAADAKELAEVACIDEHAGNHAYELITTPCIEFDYDAFGFLDEVIENSPDGQFKQSLMAFSDENGKTRTKAFMKGDWASQADGELEESPRIVRIEVMEDDEKCFGLLKEFPESLSPWNYSVDDIYWKDFLFKGDTPVMVMHITRLNDGRGTIEYLLSTVKLDMEKGEMAIHITGDGLIVSDRIWTKVN